MYAETAIMLLLPELELGLFDDNWRIRYSSIQLLGDLLYKYTSHFCLYYFISFLLCYYYYYFFFYAEFLVFLAR